MKKACKTAKNATCAAAKSTSSTQAAKSTPNDKVEKQQPSGGKHKDSAAPSASQHKKSRSSKTNKKAAAESSSQQTASAASACRGVTPPKLAKPTPFEFMHSWTSLKSSQGVEPYVSLIQQIQPQDFPNGIYFFIIHRKNVDKRSPTIM